MAVVLSFLWPMRRWNVQIDVGFEQVGAEAMPQGVDALAAPQAGTVLGRVIDPRGGGGSQRPGPLVIGKEPFARSFRLPVLAQFVEQLRREQGVAILVTLA